MTEKNDRDFRVPRVGFPDSLRPLQLMKLVLSEGIWRLDFFVPVNGALHWPCVVEQHVTTILSRGNIELWPSTDKSLITQIIKTIQAHIRVKVNANGTVISKRGRSITKNTPDVSKEKQFQF